MNDHSVILFDGVCNFCNGMVNFVIRQDRKDLFRFAPLQSQAARELLRQHGMNENQSDSFVLLEGNKTYTASTAAIRVCEKLPWYWQWLRVFWILPRRFRDGIYHFIARKRYQWFGKKEQCMVPGEKIRGKFL